MKEEQAPELTAAEEAALDAVWNEIGKELALAWEPAKRIERPVSKTVTFKED